MRTAIIYVSLVALGCTGQSLDVGETDAGTVGTGGSFAGTGGTSGTIDPPRGPELSEWPAPTGCVAATNLDVVGVWEGKVQSFSFETLVPLRLEILGASELGGVCGTLRWGEGAPPAPVTDPNRGWPVESNLGFGGYAGFLYEGATYTILDGGAQGDVVRFRIGSSELWRDWCSLQTPHYNPSGAWGCLPPWDAMDTTEDGTQCILYDGNRDPVVIEGGRCNLCITQMCTCNEERCAADPAPNYPDIGFDLLFDEDRATGRLVGIDVSATLGVADPNTTSVVLERVE